MKVAILAGGKGTRLAEETEVRPKPMVEIGSRPLLWYILKHYSHYGFNDFAIALGYKGDYIKKYFTEYSSLIGNLTVTIGGGGNGHGAAKITKQEFNHPNWTIDLIDTGNETLTGGRVKRLQPYLGDSTFMLTWGDGLSNVNLHELVAFHRAHGRLATVTAVRPPARYGHMKFSGDQVVSFEEKPQTAEGWINGAFFVLEPEVLKYIDGDATMFEHAPMVQLAKDGELMAYRHSGFWACVDTLRDKTRLQDMWDANDRPWAMWERAAVSPAAFGESPRKKVG